MIAPGVNFVSEDGFKYNGDLVSDTVCLGNGDVHTTVCLDDQRFYAVKNLQYDDWFSILHNHAVIEAVFGLGYAEQESNSYSFIARAVHEGLLEDNVFAM